MGQHVIFPAPSAGGEPRDYGWDFATEARVALKIRKGAAGASTPAQTLGPELSREALDRSLARGEEEPAAPYFYTRTENLNPDDPREVDFVAFYGPVAASGDGCWGATAWYKAMPEQPVVEVMPTGVLLGCAGRGDAEGCRAALAHGANPNYRDGSTSVLSAAVEGRSMEVVELLIGGGLDPDQGRDVAWLVQPLVETGERALLELLLSFLRPPEDRWSRLLAVSSDTATAELLEAHGASVASARGADVNAMPSYGGTALDLAVGRWELPAIRALLAHGADPHLVSDGRSSFEIARESGRHEEFQALVAECSKAGPSVPAAAGPLPDTAPPEPGPVDMEECEAASGRILEAPPRKRTFLAWLLGR
jgi:hypothetical protein